MKKLILPALISACLFSCNNSSSTETSLSSADSTMVHSDTMESMDGMLNSAADSAINMEEGMMVMFGGKMMIFKNKRMAEMMEPMTCSDGCQVKPSGEIIMTDGGTMMMKEGDIINKEGQIIHPAGNTTSLDEAGQK